MVRFYANVEFNNSGWRQLIVWNFNISWPALAVPRLATIASANNDYDDDPNDFGSTIFIPLSGDTMRLRYGAVRYFNVNL